MSSLDQTGSPLSLAGRLVSSLLFSFPDNILQLFKLGVFLAENRDGVEEIW